MISFLPIATAIDSAETIEHLTGSGLFGVFVLMLLVIGMDKVVAYKAQKDRLRAEEARTERNEKGLMESRRVEAESRDKLSEALNNVSRMAERNGIKIDEMTDDLKAIGEKVGEHAVKIHEHDNQIAELQKDKGGVK